MNSLRYNVRVVGLLALSVSSNLLATGVFCPIADSRVKVQAVSAWAENVKVGFECPGILDPCERKFFLVRNADRYEMCSFETSSLYHYTVFKREHWGGDQIEHAADFDPVTCSAYGITGTTDENITKQYAYSEYQVDPRYGVGPIITECFYSSRIDGSEMCAGECHDNMLDPSYQMIDSYTLLNDACGQLGFERMEKWQKTVLGVTNTFTKLNSETFDVMGEYTTAMANKFARNCALKELNETPLEDCGSCNAVPAGELKVSWDRSRMTLSRWRLEITGTEAGQRYHLKLHWLEEQNGRMSAPVESRVVESPDSKVWHYPTTSGELITPRMSEVCNFEYRKELIGATLTRID